MYSSEKEFINIFTSSVQFSVHCWGVFVLNSGSIQNLCGVGCGVFLFLFFCVNSDLNLYWLSKIGYQITIFDLEKHQRLCG